MNRKEFLKIIYKSYKSKIKNEKEILIWDYLNAKIVDY